MALDRDLVVVMGDRRYRVERGWGEASDESPLRLISSIAVDARGRVYAYQRAEPPVVVFDPDGRVHATWGEDQVADPHGLTVAPDGRVLLVDRDAHQVLVFTADGEQVGAIGTRHSPRFQAPFNHPTGVAVAPDGEIYVSDGYGNSVVHRFAADGTHRATWGRPGSGPGEFTTPHAVAVDGRDRVLVVDRENNRVQLFDREGTYLDEWGDLYHPMDIFVDDRGMTFVTDQTPRISLFAPDGELVGRCRAVWNIAHGIAGNAAGDLYLAEMQPSRITRLMRVE